MVPKPKDSGFTLIEIMVSLGILGVLASLAAPSFSNAVRQYRVNAVCDDLMGSIQWARSEAVKRGVPIILVRTTGCGVTLLDSNDWTCGWQAVVDVNLNGVNNTGEPIVQVSKVPVGYGVMHPGLGTRLVLNRWGQAKGVGQKFVLTPPEGVAGPATTTICINSGGRIRKLTGEVACI
jgi:type IV fimbrial biogenesis protein FimT